MSVIQLIDEDKKFSPDVLQYFTSLNIANAGLDYDIVAVFGSQSTGKSTLLNALFGTKFGVMDVKQRRQTTKGIWMGAETPRNDESSTKHKPLLVLDVEGTDGRERGEDQDFERKSALFALATSELLIINMWENQVGLYVGANMALLRTVFEVNLSLFQTGHGKTQRSRLMFAIRDYLGLTPLNELAQTLTEDLERQWVSVSKPPGLEDSQLSDFFDLDFVGLPNKMLQQEAFVTETGKMLHQIKSNFRPEYHRNVPLDGWPMYGDQVWQQIEQNKDLDLPTHQILVARFRCEEIANATFAEFETNLASQNLPFGEAAVIPRFGEILRKSRQEALQQFDEMAGRYHPTVYTEKRLELLGRVDGVLTAYFSAQLSALATEALQTFASHLESSANSRLPFKNRILAATAAAENQFTEIAQQSVIDPSFFSFRLQQEELGIQLQKAATEARLAELRRVLKRASKRLASLLDPIDLHFSNYPSKLATPWDAIEETLNSAITGVLTEYPEEGLGLGGTPEEIESANLQFQSEAWRVFANKISTVTTPDAVLQRMRDRFEDVFKYTPGGLPIVWSPGDDIETAAMTSRKAALQLLPVFSSAKLSTGGTLVVPSPVVQQLRDAEEDVPNFDLLLTAQQQQEVERRFQRVADSAFVEAKRSVLQLTTHIPPYIYAIIAVLGWNEFTMVLRNPLLLVSVLMIGAAIYVIYNLGMAGPVINVIESTVNRVLIESKQYLRNVLLSDSQPSSSAAGERPTPVVTSSDDKYVRISPLISPMTTDSSQEDAEDYMESHKPKQKASASKARKRDISSSDTLPHASTSKHTVTLEDVNDE